MTSDHQTMSGKLKALARQNKILRSLGMSVGAPLGVRLAAKRQGLHASLSGGLIEIRRGKDVLRMARHHILYVFDVINSFDYYFDAVRPARVGGMNIVDYSRPSYHEVLGYDLIPVFFPSFSEPFITTQQYLDFAQLSPGQVAIDLGAYSGLSAIAFKDKVGSAGTVLAVEADQQNLAAVERNLALYKTVSGESVELLFGAVWRDNHGLSFSTEGNMGSSAASIVGSGRGETLTVPSFTLSAIADRYNLPSVDFIKADIEGGEAFIFEDRDFFARYSPRIVVEPHLVDGRMSTEKVTRDLEAFGYRCETVPQLGSEIPLLVCTPSR
ncbi:FkbM family methyltransferase [Sphingomonas sp.]|uniref:FkbM family methyltransferase n=1 Tax=Sphingomonas sp. TaxID=28214 RepID=UPI002E0EEDF2|nr:FkbM family methyltransferase [Sphingomonas sp.]